MLRLGERRPADAPCDAAGRSDRPILSAFLLDKAFRGNAKPVLLIGYFLICVFVLLLIPEGVTSNAAVLELDLILADMASCSPSP